MGISETKESSFATIYKDISGKEILTGSSENSDRNIFVEWKDQKEMPDLNLQSQLAKDGYMPRGKMVYINYFFESAFPFIIKTYHQNYDFYQPIFLLKKYGHLCIEVRMKKIEAKEGSIEGAHFHLSMSGFIKEEEGEVK